jgi:uncharacterized protein YndB with AHSA1/START domain
MTNPQFVYTTYIKSTPEKVWAAITNPEFTRQYWVHDNISDWKKGSKWQHVTAERAVRIEGRVLESNPPKLLVLSWADPKDLADESRVTLEIHPMGEVVRLDVVHGDFKPGSTMVEKVSQGWPRVLSNLKSFLETGKPFDLWNLKAGCDAA